MICLENDDKTSYGCDSVRRFFAIGSEVYDAGVFRYIHLAKTG